MKKEKKVWGNRKHGNERNFVEADISNNTVSTYFPKENYCLNIIIAEVPTYL